MFLVGAFHRKKCPNITVSLLFKTNEILLKILQSEPKVIGTLEGPGGLEGRTKGVPNQQVSVLHPGIACTFYILYG